MRLRNHRASWALLATLAAACGDDTVSSTSDAATSGATDETTAGGSTEAATSASSSSDATTTQGGASESGTSDATSVGPSTTASETTTSDATTGVTTGVTTGATTDATTGGLEEICDNGVDDDDNGEIDDGCPCDDGASQPCFPFPESGVGECQAGAQLCVGDAWGACEGALGPVDEICDNLDNNCDDEVDETCECMVGEVGDCYPGPEGTQDVGICQSGTQLCEVEDGVAFWGPCAGFVLPEDADECNDELDNDCDGLVDVQEASLGVCSNEPLEPPAACSDDQLNPDLGGLSAAAFSYTGGDQQFMVPGGVSSIWVKLWGAGGGSWNANQGGAGGGGGFALANLSVTPGEMLTVIVGQRGEDSFSQTMIFGGGGHGGFFAGNGGGRSAIRRGLTELATAGGGGGAGGCNVQQPCPDGGAGGGASGADGEDPPLADATYGTRGYGATHTCGGAGGTTTCGCTLQSGMGGGGSQFQGGVTIMAAPG
ncbi:MAG: hypothetical protein H6713_12575 [Myxococcales bacterium]|nr:hypothetical protein [Myxococcales bacterium]